MWSAEPDRRCDDKSEPAPRSATCQLPRANYRDWGLFPHNATADRFLRLTHLADGHQIRRTGRNNYLILILNVVGEALVEIFSHAWGKFVAPSTRALNARKPLGKILSSL